MSEVPFAVQHGEAGIRQNSQETLRNMYAQIVNSGRSKIVRRQRACLRAVYTLAGEKRCIERHKGVHYLVVGDVLYSFDGITATSLGTLGSSTGRCTMIFNDNDEIMVSDGAAAYYWDGVTLATVTIPAGISVGSLAYLGGFGLTERVGTDVFYTTDANDFSEFPELNFATAESSPDSLKRVFTDHNEAWLAGTETTEIWQLTGGSDFAFQAVTSAKIERGTAAAFSYAAEDNTVIFLGDDIVVYRAEGYRPLRISTDAIEEAIRACSASAIAAADAFIYTIGGQKFYTLRIPDELTVQYNFASGLWNLANTYGYDDWRVMGSAGKTSDYVLTDTGIAALDTSLSQDEGGIVRRVAISAPGWAEGRRITMSKFRLDCEVGRGPIGEDNEVMLRVARDGETFGNIRTRSLGETGEYNTHVVWTGLGQGEKPVLELSKSDNAQFAIMGTLLTAEVSD